MGRCQNWNNGAQTQRNTARVVSREYSAICRPYGLEQELSHEANVASRGTSAGEKLCENGLAQLARAVSQKR
jgi:hypothetical protein